MFRCMSCTAHSAISGAILPRPPAVPHIRAGRMTAVAVSTPTRAAALPEVSTVAEQGFPGFDVTNWQGVLAPAGTPPAIITRLNAAFDAVLAEPATRQKLEEQGFEIVGGAPDVLAATLRDNLPRWREVIRVANIRAD